MKMTRKQRLRQAQRTAATVWPVRAKSSKSSTTWTYDEHNIGDMVVGEYTGELLSDEAGETREEAPAIQIEWATYYPLVASSVQAALESSQLVPSSGENAAWV